MNRKLHLLISNDLGFSGSWPQLASNLLRFSLSMNRSADLRIGALGTAFLKGAESEFGAPIARFMVAMRFKMNWGLSLNRAAAEVTRL